MTPTTAHTIARVLADHGHTTSDSPTHADLDAAAEYAGHDRPATPDDRDAIRTALDALLTHPA